MNIYEKMLSITNEIKNVNKNLEVGVGKSSYKAVGEADILKAVKELEKKYKVYSYPVDRKVIDKEILQTRKEYNGQVTEGNQLFMRLEVIYRFVNIEKPDEFIDIKTYGDGVDTQDKAPGKAMTYADKYALMKAYKIITGEDPDQNPSPEKVMYNKRNKNVKEKSKQEEVIEDGLVSDVQAKGIYKALINKLGSNEEVVEYLMNKYEIENTSKLMKSQYVEIINDFKK